MDSIRAQIPYSVPPIDRADLLRRCLGRVDVVDRILAKFRRTLAEDLAQLELAISARDADQIAHIAHRIKGASLSVAAYSLTDRARRMENSAATRQLDAIPASFEQLQDEASRILELDESSQSVELVL